MLGRGTAVVHAQLQHRNVGAWEHGLEHRPGAVVEAPFLLVDADAGLRDAGTDLARDPVRLRREAVRANVRASVNHLRHGSDIIERLALEDGLLVVGAELDLDTGEVLFFDPPQDLI